MNDRCGLTATDFSALRRCALAVLSIVPLLLLPVGAEAATPAPYTVTYRTGAPLKLLPFDTPSYPLTGSSYRYADARLPFEVTFFDRVYTEAAVSTFGYISFGRYADAGVLGAPNYAAGGTSHDIPSEWRTPNRIVALWWGRMDCRSPATIKSQLRGEEPHRQYVIEWRDCWSSPFQHKEGSVNMQVVFTENSSTIEVHYGELEPGSVYLDSSFAVGMMTDLPNGEFASTGFATLPCTPTCGYSDWLTDTRVIYSQEPDLDVTSVIAGPSAYPGIALPIEATIENRGTRVAKDFKVSFYLSPTRELGPDAIALGDATTIIRGDGTSTEGGELSLPSGASARFRLRGALPADLARGVWYVIAEADKDGELADPIRDNNRRASEPLLVYASTPDLAVGEIAPLEPIEPGQTFSLRWIAQNVGSGGAADIPYTIRISTSESITLTNRELGAGTLTLDAFTEEEIVDPIEIPVDALPGTYRIGVIIDPHGTIEEISTENNVGSSEPILIATAELAILTRALPSAELGAPWCKVLEAAGGDGIHVWSVAPGSTLPPGLALERRLRPSMGGHTTSLCGRPIALGAFEFTLQVRSGGRAVRQELSLQVGPGDLPLSIATHEIPVALFDWPYTLALTASGGLAPYSWTLRLGALPSGLQLQPDGKVTGAPLEDGHFPFTVQVEDAGGRTAMANLNLVVAPPSRLSCATPALPAGLVGQAYAGALRSAGGQHPYVWSSVESRQLRQGPAELPHELGVSPPGLSLSAEGAISGIPTRAGRFLWTVEVSDASHTSDICTFLLQVEGEHGLTVTTVELSEAIAGAPYHSKLSAVGGVAPYTWGLVEGSKLPRGLRLSPAGLIDGTVDGSQLEADTDSSSSFVVEVLDSQHLRGLAPLSLSIRSAPSKREGDLEDRSSTKPSAAGGCHSSAAAPSLFGAALYLAVLGRHRPRSK